MGSEWCIRDIAEAAEKARIASEQKAQRDAAEKARLDSIAQVEAQAKEKARLAAIERARQDSLSTAKAEAEAILRREEVTKANQKNRFERLRAPDNGTIQQLDIHTIGGVVEAAKPLMVLVPSKGGIEVRANILNKDVGFVHVGQEVAVKLEAFPFTRYGTVPGRVTHGLIVGKDKVAAGGATPVGAPPGAGRARAERPVLDLLRRLGQVGQARVAEQWIAQRERGPTGGRPIDQQSPDGGAVRCSSSAPGDDGTALWRCWAADARNTRFVDSPDGKAAIK